MHCGTILTTTCAEALALARVTLAEYDDAMDKANAKHTPIRDRGVVFGAVPYRSACG